MATLTIDVKGLGQLGGAGSPAQARRESRRQLTREQRLARNIEKIRRDSLQRISRFRQSFGRLATRFALVEETRRLKIIERLELASLSRRQRRILAFGRAASIAGRGIGAGGAVLGRGLARGGAVAAGGLGAALGGLGGGGGIGGLVRSAGGLGSVGVNLAGSVAGSFAGALPTAIGSALGPVGGAIGSAVGTALSGALRGVAAIGGGVLQAAGNLGALIAERILGAVKIGIIAGLGIAIASAVRAARGAPIRAAFEELSKRIGEDAVEALDLFKEATEGLVPELELLEQANTSIQLGVIKSAEEFAGLARTATILGRAVGRGPVQALRDLNIGIARQSPRLLDNIGLQIKLESVNRKTAEALGRTTNELTDLEKIAGFAARTLELAAQKVAGLEGTLEGPSAEFTKFKTTILDTSEVLGTLVLEGFGALAAPLARITARIGEFLGSDAAAERLEGALAGVRNRLESIADFLEGSTFQEAIDEVSDSLIRVWDRFRITAIETLGDVAGFAAATFSSLKTDLDKFFASAAQRVAGLPGADAAGAVVESRRRIRRERAFTETRGDVISALSSFPDERRPLSLEEEAPRPTRGPLVTAGLVPALDRNTKATQDSTVATVADIRAKRPGAIAGPSGRIVAGDRGGRTGVTGGGGRLADIAGELGLSEFFDSLGALSKKSEATIRKRLAALDREEKLSARVDKLSASRTARIDGLGRSIEESSEAVAVRSRLIERLAAKREEIEEEKLRIELRIERVATERLAAEERIRASAIRAANEAETRAIRGAAGRLGGARGLDFLPPNLRRGFERRERRERRGPREEARRRFGGISAGTIARASPEEIAGLEAALLDIDARARAPLEAARVEAISALRDKLPSLSEELERVRAESAEALAEELARIAEAAEASTAAAEEERDLLGELAGETRKAEDAARSARSTIILTLQRLVDLEKQRTKELKAFQKRVRAFGVPAGP